MMNMADTSFEGLAMLADIAAENADLQPIITVIQSIIDLPEDSLNAITVESLQGMTSGAITPQMRKQAVEQIITNYKNNNATRGTVKNEISTLKSSIVEVVNELDLSAKKTAILNSIFNILYELFDEVIARYLNYDVELPMALEGDAKVPTYAHETDAAADLYALETTVIKANSRGNMIRTGVRIGLPEGWVAYIVPRSSIGTKTPLRLSNSVGVIDAGYRGELCVLYDNISDSDYTINAGDRIAQLIVMPSYHFKAEVVDILDTTERGEDGFGASGK